MSPSRIAGAIVAVLLLIPILALLFATAAPESVVKPEVNVVASEGQGPIAELNASKALQSRSRLLGDRRAAGAIDGVDVAASEKAQADLSFKERDGSSDFRLSQWGERSPIARDTAKVRGSSSLPYKNANVLEEPASRDWRRSRNEDIYLGGGWVIVGVLFALALFLFARGRIRIAEGPAGSTVQRFDAIERANHWMTATSFVVMALTGLIILYGKTLVLPLVGEPAFGQLAWGSAWLHMASSVPFVVGIVAMMILWLRENIPTRLDWNWLKAGGGFLHDDGENPPARRFNAGQKIVFWGVVVGGFAALLSGLALMFPYFWFDYFGMQWAQLTHAVIGILMIALIFGHIYIGTIGMEGAFDAMWSGRVDSNWAKEHHRVWWQEKARYQSGPAIALPDKTERIKTRKDSGRDKRKRQDDAA